MNIKTAPTRLAAAVVIAFAAAAGGAGITAVTAVTVAKEAQAAEPWANARAEERRINALKAKKKEAKKKAARLERRATQADHLLRVLSLERAGLQDASPVFLLT